MLDVSIITSLASRKDRKKDFIKQDVSPSRASSAKQRTVWEGKGLHTGTETSVPGTVKQVRGEVEEVKGSD